MRLLIALNDGWPTGLRRDPDHPGLLHMSSVPCRRRSHMSENTGFPPRRERWIDTIQAFCKSLIQLFSAPFRHRAF